METIQVVLDAMLLKAVDLIAKRQKANRSALIRRALQEHLKRLRVLELDERDRRGYQARPQRTGEYRPWEEAAALPEDSLTCAEAKKVRRGTQQLKDGKTKPWSQVKRELGL
jgi:hypothetical protein